MATEEKIENGKSDEELEKEIMESAEAKNEEEVKDDIPAYCVGKPYGGRKVCYLGYDSAYEKNE